MRFLLDELRHARAARAMTQDDLAAATNYSPSTIAMVETGARRPPAGFWERVDTAMKTGGSFARLAARLGSLRWMREWEHIEREATVLRSYESVVVPGLLQTEAYARAVLSEAGRFDPDEVAQLVTSRLERQSILARERPPDLTVILDEGVLRRPVGNVEIMREQLRELVKAAAAPKVHLQVVRIEVGAHAGLNGPFVIATAPDDSDVIYLDNQLHGEVIDRKEDVRAVVRAWESIRSEAMPHRLSVELLSEVAERWT
jgi:transcriptional regulator with XRE-family HTH domain